MTLRNRSGFNALRFVVTLGTFGLILWWIDPRELVSVFTNVVWFWVIVRVIPYAASLWIQAWRWKLFLGLEGITTDTNRLFRRIWMARFFANTLPGSLGGDIFRVVESNDFSGSKMAVARSVLLDRVVALVSLGVYTSVACLVWAWRNNWDNLAWIAVLGLIGSVIALLLFATEWPGRMMRSSAEKLHSGRVKEFSSRLADSLRDLAGQRRLLATAAVTTIIFNVTWAISSYLGFLAFDLAISPLLVITLMPVVYTVTTLPISINGLGVSEGVFVLVFVAAGLEPVDAAAVAILLRVTGILMSGFGGLLYLIEMRRFKRVTS